MRSNDFSSFGGVTEQNRDMSGKVRMSFSPGHFALNHYLLRREMPRFYGNLDGGRGRGYDFVLEIVF